MRQLTKIILEALCLLLVYNIDLNKIVWLSNLLKDKDSKSIVLKTISLVLAMIVIFIINKLKWFYGSPVAIEFSQENKIFETNQTQIFKINGKNKQNFEEEEAVVRLKFKLDTFNKFNRFFLRMYLKKKNVCIEIMPNNSLLMVKPYLNEFYERFFFNENGDKLYFDITRDLMRNLEYETSYREKFYYKISPRTNSVENGCDFEIICSLKILSENKKVCKHFYKFFFKSIKNQHSASYVNKIDTSRRGREQ